MSTAFPVSHRTTRHRVARCAAALLLTACGDVSGGVTIPDAAQPPGANAPTLVDLPVTPISISGIGVTETISATIRDALGRTIAAADMSWSSDDPTVAEVTSSGAVAYVVARAAGETEIRATAGKATSTVHVRVLGVRSLTVTPKTVSVRAGDLLPLSVTVQGDPGVSTSVQWSVLNPSVATVNASGVVTGVAVGTTDVLARSVANPAITATVAITVTRARTVSLAPDLAALTMWVGDSKTIPAQVDVDSLQSRGLVWSSANVSVASVSNTGAVTALRTGTTIIRVSAVADERAQAEILLTVFPARTVAVAPTAISIGMQRQTTLRATVVVENNLPTTVRWSTSDAAIATVSTAGIVTGVALGRATISAVSTVDSTRRASAVVTVAPSVRAITVTPSTLAAFTGAQDQLVADVTADAPIARTVTWRSSSPAVATVSATGMVSSISVGQTTITATATADTSIRATSAVTVQTAPPVVVSPAQSSIVIGESRTLSGRVTVPGTANTAVTWRSSNATVVAVGPTGVVVGQSVGTATITLLLTADSTRRATASVTVLPSVRSVTVSPATASGFAGQSVQLAATVLADGALPLTSTWRSSDATVASVSTSGAVSLLKAGQATITALSIADTTKRATATVTVTVPRVQSVSLSPANVGLAIGQTQQLVAAASVDAPLSTSLILRTSNAAVATVTSGGVVTAIANGSATITAIAQADTTKRATATITVSLTPVTVWITTRPVAVTVGQTRQLLVNVSAGIGTSSAVTWTSTSSAVATVNANGLVSALAPGSALVTATSVADPSKRDTVTVTSTAATTQLATSWSASRMSGALYEDVVSTVGFGAGSAFAVNIVGDVFRWDGTSWTASLRGAVYGGQFVAVHGSSATNVIAVGTNGLVARFDGTAWIQMSSGTTASLADVWVDGIGSAYAVGANGSARRWNGSTWNAMTTGSSQSLNGVWAIGATVYAVGTSGEVLRFDGTAWTRMTVPTSATLFSVSGSAANNVVAVGASGTVLRFNGTSWSAVSNSVTTADLYAVDGTAANNGRLYIAGGAGLLQLDGSALSLASTPYTLRLFAVSTDAGGTVWTGGQRGSVMRLSGSWSTTNLSPDLLDVWSTSPSSAWAVGEFGFVHRWNGSSWSRQSTPTTASLFAVWGASATDAFAGGDNGTMLRFNGSTWSAMTFPSSATINAIWGMSSSDVYAVTAAGEVARYNGSAWAIVTTTASPLWSVYGMSSTEVYVSGENGTLLRYNGSTWNAQSAGLSGTLVGLWGNATSSLMTVGLSASGAIGAAYKFNNASWTSQSIGTTRVLTSVWGPNGADVYATGDQGTMLRYNGTSWQSMITGTTDLLWSVSGSPSGSGAAFAVGYNSTIITGSGAGGFVAASLRVVNAGLDPSPSARLRASLAMVPDGNARAQRKGLSSAVMAGRAATPPSATAMLRARAVR